MDSNNLFIMATQHKFRFPFKGQVSVEDLWDLNVHDLDTVFKALNAQSKQSKEESLLASKSKADSILEAKIEVVKYIVTAKLAEAEAHQGRSEGKEAPHCGDSGRQAGRGAARQVRGGTHCDARCYARLIHILAGGWSNRHLFRSGVDEDAAD